MATTKTIKIQNNKILTYTINKPGFKTITRSVRVSMNKNINIDLKNINSQDEPYQIGDRLFDISTFVDYFTPSGEYDVDSLKYITAHQTTGSNLEDIEVIKDTWLQQVEQTLSIETSKGSSNNFVFTFDGTNWDLTGAVVVNDITPYDLGEIYGISFDGTPVSGDVITVTETQYNRFAVFVLDANYRRNYAWGPQGLIMPKIYSSNPQNCLESATYYNNYVFNNKNLTNYKAFGHCKDLGNFILSNGIEINSMIPNGRELQTIYNNRVALDSFDPIIQGGTTTYNLTNWNFPSTGNKRFAWSCIDYSSREAWALDYNNSWDDHSNTYKNNTYIGIIPIFEVPVM